MSSLPDTTSSQFWYCIQKIEARHKAQKVKSKIYARLSVDGQVVHELPFIDKGQPLAWEGPLEGLGTASSVFGFQLYKPTRSVFTTRMKNIERNQLEFLASEILSRVGHPASIVVAREGEVYSVQFTFLIKTVGEMMDASPEGGKESAKESLQRLRRSQAALQTILSIGRDISMLCPNITGSALSLCKEAYKVLEERSGCDKEIEELLVPFANILGTIPLVPSKLNRHSDLERTLGEVLELIRGISEHVLALGNKPTNPKSHPIPEVESNSFTGHLRALRVGMDTWIEQRPTHLEIEAILGKLQPAHESTYHSNRKCLPGTRVSVIADAIAWVTQGSAGGQLLWIHGPAGIGKTCIAASICESLSARNMLETGFFCKWDNQNLRDPREVIKSITHGLATRSIGYGRLVASALATAPDRQSLPVSALYACLIETPILTATSSESMPGLKASCIVVDALDECETERTCHILLSCLNELSQLVPRLKVIVTSRTNESFQRSMSSLPEGIANAIDLVDYDAENDIRTFVHQQLTSSGRQHDQPDGQLVSALVENARGLFLWADVACRFLQDRVGSWSNLASLLIHPEVHTASSNPPLNQLYFALVTRAATKLGDKSSDMLNSWLAIVAENGFHPPLLDSCIQSLLESDTTTSTLQLLLEALSPVFPKQPSTSGDDGAKAPYTISRSFFEYITTPAQSKKLCLDRTQAHSKLSSNCLKTMLTELRFNMCHLETSYRRNCDVPNLDTRVRSAIDFKLGYSCRHWIDHVIAIDSKYVDMSLLRTFLSGPSLLYWIEALSLLGRLDVVVSKIPKLIKWACTHQAPIPTDVLELANDTYRFVSGYYGPISESTPHLYVTALAMVPVQSAISRVGRKWFPNTLKFAQGALPHWPCFGDGPILCVTLSTCHSMAASGSRDGSVRLWDAATGKVMPAQCESHLDSVLCVAFCPSNRLLASGSHDGTIHIQAMARDNRKESPLLKHVGPVLCLCFSTDGFMLASGLHDASICIWDTKTWTRMYAPLSGHTGPVLSICFSPDNQNLISASTDKTARVWAVTTRESVVLFGHTSWVQCVAFSPGGQYAATGGYDRSVQVWDAKTGRRACEPIVDHPGPIYYVAFLGDEQRIVYCSSDGLMRMWKLIPGSGPAIAHLDSDRGDLPVVYLCGGIYLASGTCVGTLRLWSGETGTPASALLIGHSSWVSSVAFSPDGRSIVSGSGDSTVRLWDAETGAPASPPFVGHSSWVSSVAFSPDGRRIVSGSDDRSVRLWDAEPGIPACAPLVGHSDLVWFVVFTPDGQRIVSGSRDKTVRMWDAETGTPASAPFVGPLAGGWSVAFSPNGRRIVSGSRENTARLWDTESGNLACAPLVGHSDWVRSVAFSPDGRRVVSGSDDRTVRVWDAETGAPASAPFVGHSDWVRCVAFSPDGRRIVSGSRDNTVRLWDAETGTPACAPLVGHFGEVNSVAFSPDGRHVVSGSGDHTIRIWAADTNSMSLGLPADTTGLAPFLQSDGWVSTPDHPRLLWLPSEYRRPETEKRDDSLICIGQDRDAQPNSSRVVIDYSRFVHGALWTLVAAESN